jgi:NAD(P)-dependent dehydrogenase (short-subunit alcohol dehydrogenase family)
MHRGDKYSDSGMTPYGTSKIYMMMLAKELSTRVPEVDFFCVQPGACERAHAFVTLAFDL